MKDISLAKTGVTGERLYNKAQDFVYDEVLFQYCLLPQVSLLHATTHTTVVLMVYNFKLANRFWTMWSVLLGQTFALCIQCLSTSHPMRELKLLVIHFIKYYIRTNIHNLQHLKRYFLTGPALLPVSPSRSYRVLLDSNGAHYSRKRVSNCLARNAQRNSSSTRLSGLGERCQ